MITRFDVITGQILFWHDLGKRFFKNVLTYINAVGPTNELAYIPVTKIKVLSIQRFSNAFAKISEFR